MVSQPYRAYLTTNFSVRKTALDLRPRKPSTVNTKYPVINCVLTSPNLDCSVFAAAHVAVSLEPHLLDAQVR